MIKSRIPTFSTSKIVLSTIWILALALFISGPISTRWTDNHGGYPSSRWDFGSHFSIIESLKQGRFFLELDQPIASEHTISRFLPIYHGILGSHALALAVSLVAESTTRSMQIVTDIAFLVGLFSLLYLALKLNVSVSGLVAVLYFFSYYFILMTSFGYFSQTTGTSIALLAWAISPRWKYLKLFFWVISGWCYPDVLLLILPWEVYRRKTWDGVRIFLAATFVLLISVLIGRLNLKAAIIEDPIFLLGYFLLITFGALLFADILFTRGRSRFKWWTENMENFYVLTFVTTTLVLFALSWLWVGHISYYSQKLVYWTPTILLIVLSRFKSPLQHLILLCVASYVIWDWNEASRVVNPFLEGKSILSHEMELTARRTIKTGPCQNGIFYIPSTEGASQIRAPGLIIALSALTGRYTVNEGTFDLADFGKSKVIQLEYEDVAKDLFSRFPNAVLKSPDENWSYLCPP
jgi:hypothetical protein